VAVIGGGSAGYAAARVVSAAGLRTIVIEGGEEVGGLCILRGCMPTKALLYAGEVLHLARNARTWGIEVGKIDVDFRSVMKRKDALITEFADYRRQQLETGKFEFVRATARFIDPHTVTLSTGQTITAAHFVVSSGSSVSPSPLPQLDDVGYLTSDSALKLESPPKSLIILGGGATAVEFGQFFTRMGVKVTMIQRSPHVLHEFDSDAVAVVEEVFRREGIELFTGTRLLDARREGNSKSISFLHNGEKRHVIADEIFFGLGRTPNTQDLDLEKAGVMAE